MTNEPLTKEKLKLEEDIINEDFDREGEEDIFYFEEKYVASAVVLLKERIKQESWDERGKGKPEHILISLGDLNRIIDECFPAFKEKKE